MLKTLLYFSFLILALSPAAGEMRSYGAIDLTGLSRNDWHLNLLGETNTMVCNVNGPDGFLTIRDAPTSNSPANRKLNRLAIVVVDTGIVQGNWVRVVTAYRTHTSDGRPQAYKDLHVSGWAHTGYLCDYLD